MNETKRKPWRRYTFGFLLLLLAAIFALTIAGWRHYIRTVGMERELLGDRAYDRHYVLITEETSSLLWQDIYSSAKKAAAESGAYLEFLGGWDTGEYSPTDYMKIAIAAKVDGIIVKPDGTAKMAGAINAADAAGIPVVTVLEDEPGSSRKSFVGVNSYQLGTMYGRQILRCINRDTDRVTVLLNHGDAGKDLVYKQLRATVQDGLRDGQEVQIESMTIADDNTFGAEEMIRDLLHGEDTRPDILVCMNETNSECAYYAMVDYNQVGKVQLIGYYPTVSMLGAVQKGIVPMVITLDAGQLGRYGVEALEEYYSMGYVSSYISVDLSIITQENVGDFIPEAEPDA